MFWEAQYNQHHHAIWASKEKDARAIAKQFDFNFMGGWSFSLPPELRPSKFLKRFDPDFILRRPELMHAAVFLSFLAARAKFMTPDMLLNDTSAVHELVHYTEFGNGFGLDYMRGRLLALEKMIPGLPPESVDLPFSVKLKAYSDQLIEPPVIPAATAGSSQSRRDAGRGSSGYRQPPAVTRNTYKS